jgi:hypothetical protein
MADSLSLAILRTKSGELDSKTVPFLDPFIASSIDADRYDH